MRFNVEAGNPFEGKVDLGNIALIGHSRGGEAVANAAAFNKLSHYPDDASVHFNFDFDIKGIISIAPVDGQYPAAADIAAPLPRSTPSAYRPAVSSSPSMVAHVSGSRSADCSVSGTPRFSLKARKLGMSAGSARASSSSRRILFSSAGMKSSDGFARFNVRRVPIGSPGRAAWSWLYAAPPSSIFTNGCQDAAGRVPMAIIREPPIFAHARA